MKFFEIKAIADAKNTSFDFFDAIIKHGLILYIDSKSVIKILEIKSFNTLFQESLNCVPFIQYCNSNIYLRNPDDTLYKLDFQNGKIELFYKAQKLDGFEASIGLISASILLESQSKYENYALSERISKLIDIESKSLLYSWNTIHDIIYFNDDLVYFQSIDGYLICRDINTGLEKWKVDFDNDTQVKRVYAESNSVLYIHLTRSRHKQFKIAALNKATSTIIWEIATTFSHYNYDELNSKLYGLGGRTFEVINVETGERELQKELDINLHVSAHLTYYADGYLYFSGRIDNNIPVFGAVDVATGELAFTQEVEMPGERSFRKGLDRPVVVGNRLYVRDSMKTLHIFERELHS